MEGVSFTQSVVEELLSGIVAANPATTITMMTTTPIITPVLPRFLLLLDDPDALIVKAKANCVLNITKKFQDYCEYRIKFQE